MGLVLVTPPAAEPLSTGDAKQHLRVDDASDDQVIGALVIATRHWAEKVLRQALVTQTWDLTLDAFPACLEVPRPPLQSVTWIRYVDPDGVLQTLSASLYQVDAAAKPARIVPAYDQSWPDTRAQLAAVSVRFVAGYGLAQDVPQWVKAAMKLYLGALYEGRGDTAPLIDTAERMLLANRL